MGVNSNFINSLFVASLSKEVVINRDCQVRLKKDTPDRLNTSDIAHLSERAFAQTTDPKEAEKLGVALTHYLRRVQTSKSGVLEIMHRVFGIKSFSEYRIQRIINKLRNNYLDLVDHSYNYETKDSLKHKFSIFYAKVLESQSEVEVLEGIGAFRVYRSYLKDLSEYYAEHPSDKILQTIEELDFAKTLSFPLMRPSTALDWKKGNMFHAMKDEVVLKIDQLRLSDDLTQTVVLPGGVYGHAVVFVIGKEIGDRLSLTIYNTGSGSFQKNGQIFSLRFSDLSREQITPELINTLLKASDNPKRFPHMKNIYAYLNKELRSSKMYGVNHSPQNHGTCAIKSISKWLHRRIEEEYPAFKEWLTGKEILEIDQINERQDLPVKRTVLEKMMNESKRVYHQRKIKRLQPKRRKAEIFSIHHKRD